MGGDRTANVMMHHRAGWKEDKIPESSTTDVVAFDRSAEECNLNLQWRFFTRETTEWQGA